MGMQLIETIEVGAGGAASIEWSAINQDGQDLVIVCSLRTTEAQRNVLMRVEFNSNTSNYSYTDLIGIGSSVFSGSGAYLSPLVANGSTSTANTFSNSSVYISNYAGSTAKSLSIDSVTENNATQADQQLVAGLWNNTAAITSVKISNAAANSVQYSTASLYKITAD
jgi:hypothetical protein